MLRIDSIVVGLPINMNGSSGEPVHRVRHFMDQLRLEVGLPLWEMDERLSTVEAGELWKGMSSRQKQKYRTIDSLAAALILERFLRES